ncbi:MAG TPA: desulfoferrodoxin family protein [Phycisphaerae bacterium]|nr:desulfoferrodoxin family protein [Phycisphaerae bacterium]
MYSAQWIQGQQEQGNEKHVPTILVEERKSEGSGVVRVVVGHDVPHPNLPEHHIAWLELYGQKADGGQILHLGRAAWAPVYADPNMRFQVNKIEDFAKLHALAYCNIHGVWGSTLEL